VVELEAEMISLSRYSGGSSVSTRTMTSNCMADSLHGGEEGASLAVYCIWGTGSRVPRPT